MIKIYQSVPNYSMRSSLGCLFVIKSGDKYNTCIHGSWSLDRETKLIMTGG
jgi:hypothetical protein